MKKGDWIKLKIDEATDLPLAIIEDTEEGLGVCEGFGEKYSPKRARSYAVRLVLAYNLHNEMLEALKVAQRNLEFAYGKMAWEDIEHEKGDKAQIDNATIKAEGGETHGTGN